MKMKDYLDSIFDKKDNGNIFILGKGPSLDAIDLSLLENKVVINTNDSELIYTGDIGVFHNGWVLDIFDIEPPACQLYVSDKVIPHKVNQINPDYIPYTPETGE